MALTQRRFSETPKGPMLRINSRGFEPYSANLGTSGPFLARVKAFGQYFPSRRALARASQALEARNILVLSAAGQMEAPKPAQMRLLNRTEQLPVALGSRSQGRAQTRHTPGCRARVVQA